MGLSKHIPEWEAVADDKISLQAISEVKIPLKSTPLLQYVT